MRVVTCKRSLMLIALIANPLISPAAQESMRQRVSAPEHINPFQRPALDIIEGEIERAKKYTHLKDAIRIWAAAADVLWDFDQSKARNLLREAYAQANSATPDEQVNEGDSLKAARRAALQQQLRTEVLSVAQRHDPSLIEELLKEAKEEEEKLKAIHNNPRVFGSSSLQKRSLARLAASIAKTDPERAVEYAAASLDYGVPEEIQDVFQALFLVDAKYARELFRKATQGFAADPSPNIFDSLILLSYLRWVPQPESDTALVKTFLGAAVDRIKRVRRQAQSDGTIDAGLRSTLFYAVNQLQPYCRLYHPEMVAEVAALSRSLAPEVRPEDVAAEELFPTEEGRNDVESILSRAAAEKDEDNRDALYFQAGVKLSDSSEHQRALEVVSKARNGENRDAVTSYIRRSLAQHLISSGDLHEALKVFERIADPEEKADVVVQFAAAARKKKDALLAQSVLQDAQKALESQRGSARHARAYLWLASSYCATDPATGFELMAAAVKAANGARELVDLRSEPKLIHLGGVSRQAVRVGESRADFRAGFRVLARTDFDRTVSIAGDFRSELFRGLALISTAGSVLKDKSRQAEIGTVDR